MDLDKTVKGDWSEWKNLVLLELKRLGATSDKLSVEMKTHFNESNKLMESNLNKICEDIKEVKCDITKVEKDVYNLKVRMGMISASVAIVVANLESISKGLISFFH